MYYNMFTRQQKETGVMANYSGKKEMRVLDKQNIEYRSGKIIEDTRYFYKVEFDDNIIALVDKRNEEKVLEFLS